MLMNRHPVFQLVEQYEIKKLPAATYKKSLFTLYGFHYLVKSNYAGYSHDFKVDKFPMQFIDRVNFCSWKVFFSFSMYTIYFCTLIVYKSKKCTNLIHVGLKKWEQKKISIIERIK